PATPPDPRRVTLAAALGLVPAFVIAAITFVKAIVRPDALSQTYDAVLHYNAVRYILDTGHASSLTMSSLGDPGISGRFYPAAWHDLVSLVVLSGGNGIPVSVNLVSAVIGLVVWPVSCLLLVRQVIGRSATGMAITGLVSIAFTAFPWDLLGFGVLWPNLLAMALVPAVLALVISITGQANEDAIGKGRAWLMLPVALVATGLAHPNAVFTVIALSLVPIGIALVMRTRRLSSQGLLWRGVGECVLAFVVFMAFWYWAATSPVFASVRNFHWKPFDTPAQAVGEVLFHSMNRYNALWVLALVTLGGILLCRRFFPLRWVVGGFVISGFLYVVAAAFNRPDTAEFTGFWYNDPHRLSAMVPITTVPIAVVALMFLGQRGAELLRRPRLPELLRKHAFAASTLIVVVLLGLFTQGFYVGKHANVIQILYVRPANQPSLDVVDQQEQAFFARVEQIVPPDAVVANNPWDGSALLWALADRRVLFPHMGISVTEDQRYLAANFNSAAVDPRVCQIAQRLRVSYLLIGDHTFWPWDKRTREYPGMADPGHTKGFQLVASSGDKLRLYQLTACAGTQ
ncbi:MAG TPA: DUF6541 family protein, partial [Pseudonocardiaceae bacterium]|nr:DUF6541 family protein [Pseudonocardiaceae bacterium]